LVKQPWHIRNIRNLIYAGLFAIAVGIAVVSYSSAPDATQAWVGARELYGLWALVLLLSAMVAGPLNFVLPWLPVRAHLILGRRALGVSAFVLASLHVGSYVGPTLYHDWHQLYTPGKLWVAGLLIGIPLLVDMTVLAITSRDDAVRQLGPRRWKKWHRSVYLALPIALLHGTFVGADFGVNKGPDVPGEPDAGSLIGMLIFAAAWLVLFILRKRRIRFRWGTR
jgi:DMSO/TMAO reductase YedYZ heme-binding membrane subunit